MGKGECSNDGLVHLFASFPLASLWLTPNADSDGGFLLAKTKNGELLYGLELQTLFAVVFSFQPPPPAVSC